MLAQYLHLMHKVKKNKEPLDEYEKGEWKSWLKTQHSKNYDLGIQSYYFMQINGDNVETVSDLIFLGSKITADGDCKPLN